MGPTGEPEGSLPPGVAQQFTKPQIIAHVEKSLDYTLYDAKWIPRSARFIVIGSRARGTGAMQIYEMSSGEGDVKKLKEVEKTDSFKCATFGASSLQQRKVATGDFKGNLHIWDIENLHKSPVYAQDKAHSEIINAMDGAGGLGQEGAPEIVTGGRDGAVRVWDVRQSEAPVARMEPVEGEARRDCWTVAFGDSHNAEDRIVAAGYDNGDLKLFDLRKMAARWETNVGNGICGLEFDRKDIIMNKLVATTLEAKFHLFDMRTEHAQKGFEMLTEKAHKSTIWAVRHLPQNRDVFMTCGGSGSLNLWKYSYPASRVKECSDGTKMGVVGTVQCIQNVIMSTQPIASFDWSPDKAGLAVCTAFDQAFRVIIVTKLNTV